MKETLAWSSLLCLSITLLKKSWLVITQVCLNSTNQQEQHTDIPIWYPGLGFIRYNVQ
jgi:hypothetical protein